MAHSFFERLRLAWWRRRQAKFEARRRASLAPAGGAAGRVSRAEPERTEALAKPLSMAPAGVVPEAASLINHDAAALGAAGDTAGMAAQATPANGARAGPGIDYVYLRGTRDLRTLGAYFSGLADAVYSDFRVMEQGVALPLNHSVFARHALVGLPQSVQRSFRRLGYRAQHFESELNRLPVVGRAVWVLNFHADFSYALYTLKGSSHAVPIALPEFRRNLADVMTLDPSVTGIGADMLAALTEKFQFTGMISEADFKANVRLMLRRAAPGTRVFILLPLDGSLQDSNATAVNPRRALINQWLAELAAEAPAVTLLNCSDYVAKDSSRVEYGLVFETILQYLDR
jgi:hypothetical protein